MTSKDIYDSIDKAFLGTTKSKGYTNAKKAIKYVLFDDKDSIEEHTINQNKWLFISNSLNGREMIKKLHHVDLMQLLIKFCFAYIGMQDRPFQMDKTKYLEYKSDMFIAMKINNEELIEFIVYSSIYNIEETYIFLSTNKDVQLIIIDLLIKERYKKKLSKEYDNFKEIAFPKMQILRYEKFIEKYHNLDLEFALIKRKTPGYGA